MGNREILDASIILREPKRSSCTGLIIKIILVLAIITFFVVTFIAMSAEDRQEVSQPSDLAYSGPVRIAVKTDSKVEQSAPVVDAKPALGSKGGCVDRRSDCKATAFLCDDPIYKPIMTEQCAKTCNRCGQPRAKRFVVVDPQAPSPSSSPHSGKAAGVFTVAEIFMSAVETLLKGLDILLVAVLKYVREGRAAISEAIDALKQAAANHRPKRSVDFVLHAADHEF